MKTIKTIAMYLWQLPQNLLGLLLLLIVKPEKKEMCGYTYYHKSSFNGGISLGDYIIVCRDDAKIVMHEYGHCIQSKMLGWLYLIVIGLPSLVWATLYGWIIPPYERNGYYKFYTEKWADKLGGVKR